MERIEKTVFLSYRRTNVPWALAIFQNLTQHGFDVFFDYSGIASGDFEQVILGNIRASAHFVVLLTPSALRRCNKPGDWLRREIETALEGKRNIVPLMLEEFSFSPPSIASQLTGKLAALKDYNGLRIVPEYFDAGMERLRTKFLNVELKAVLHPASLPAQEAAAVQKAAAKEAPPVQREELTAQEWFERGYAATDHNEEIRCFSEAIRLKPDYALAFYNRGLAYYSKRELDAAMKDYNEAIRLNPDMDNAFYNRALVYEEMLDFPTAIADYQKYLDLGGGQRNHDQVEVEGFIRDLKKKSDRRRARGKSRSRRAKPHSSTGAGSLRRRG